MTQPSPQRQYEQLLQQQQAQLVLLQRKKSRLGWLRLAVFLAIAGATYFTFRHYGPWGFATALAGLAAFLYLVSIDTDYSAAISNSQALVAINREELLCLQHQFGQRYDGADQRPPHHAYADDLDLFGPASLYQWLHRCHTEQGRQLLAKNLLAALPLTAIEERQEAVRELAADIEWRQQLQAIAAQTAITHSTEQRTANWLAQEEKHFLAPAWRWFVLAYSATSLSLLLGAIAGWVPFSLLSALYVVFVILSLILSRNTIKPYTQLSGIVKEVTVLHRLMEWWEGRSCQAPLLRRMQESLHGSGTKAAPQIRELKNILDRFDLRISLLGFLFLNPFLLWDVRQMMALNAWRKRNSAYAGAWFAVVAEAEVLHSLATLHFNQPQWCFPQFSASPFLFKAEGLGHPLIAAGARVDHDFCLQGKPKLALVTGSNMAGKSTFLRSVGVNVVLAQMGAPVCARQLSMSAVRLMSSMRIADNLAENTSTFYAELKKLKSIIEAVNRKEPLLILLDEILRGTNSLDRHKGSEALMRQLIRQGAVAVMATHDLALAGLEAEYPQVLENYHFDVQVAGEELYFDYRLKQGVCNSLNASILMKKIGIDVNG